MPSSQYSGTPKVCLLCSTNENAQPIDLLNAAGICITNPPGWIPQISQLKGGGVRIGSETLNDDTIVAGGYEPVSETFPIAVDPVDTAARVQILLNRLWEAEQYWLDGWQRGAVYLKVQLTDDSDIRYSRIKTGAFQIGVYAFGGRSGLPNNTLVLEREPAWQPVPPGEMIGPFRNLSKNPSFERWKKYGMAGIPPSGWSEQVDENFAGTYLIEAEENQIIYDRYALKMSFTGAGGGAPNEWYIWQQVRCVCDQDYTIKVWINLAMGGGAGEEFFIRLTNEDGTVVYLNQTYTTSQNGWQYLHFTMDRGWYYQVLEIGFTAPGTSVGSTAVVDHLILTEGTWDSDSWPGGDDGFYMDSSVLYSYTDPADYDYDLSRGYPIDPTNYTDIINVPGDMDALMRYALEFQQMEQMNDDYLNGQFVATATAVFMEKNAPWEYILQHNIQGDDGSTSSLGRGQVSFSLPVDTPVIIHAKQFNGDEVTQLLNHTFRVFIKSYNSGAVNYWVSYWIGDPANEIVLSKKLEPDTVPTIQSELYMITPKELINWTRAAVERYPASVGYTIYAQTAEEQEGSCIVDGAWIIPADNGGAWCEDVIATGQSLALDSASLAKPVQKAYNATPAAMDYPTNRSGFDQPVSHITEYWGLLYVFYDVNGLGTTSDEWVFDGSRWSQAMTYSGGPVSDTTEFGGLLYMCTLDGKVYTYDANTDTSTLHTNYVASCYAIQYFGDEVYTAYNNNAVSTVGGGPALIAAANIRALEIYKHQLWAADILGNTHYYDSSTAAAPSWHNGPNSTVACIDMIEWHDKLWFLGNTGRITSWDGNSIVLSRAGNFANDDYARRLVVFNDELYMWTAGATHDTCSLWKTSDGITWTEEIGLDSESNFEDAGDMAVYAGRICCVAANTTNSVWACIWHAPLIATLSIPDHTGGPMTLVPQARNRIHAMFEEERDGFKISETFATGANAAKVWILPRWRALRSD